MRQERRSPLKHLVTDAVRVTPVPGPPVAGVIIASKGDHVPESIPVQVRDGVEAHPILRSKLVVARQSIRSAN